MTDAGAETLVVACATEAAFNRAPRARLDADGGDRPMGRADVHAGQIKN